MPLEIAAVLLARLGQAGFGVLQRLAGLFGRQHRLGSANANLQLAGRPSNQAIEHLLRLIDCSLLGVDLAAAQFVIVATAAFVVLAVVFFAVVQMVERGIPIALIHRELDQLIVPGEAIRLVGTAGARHQRLGELAGQVARIEFLRG